MLELFVIEGFWIIRSIALDWWELVQVFNLFLLEVDDDREGNYKHEESEKESTGNSCAISDTLDVSVLPNDVSWVGSLCETWDNIEDSLVNEILARFGVRVSIESVLLIVKEGLIESIVRVESDEGGDRSCEKVILFFIYFAIFVHDQFRNQLILGIHLIPLAISDSIPSCS